MLLFKKFSRNNDKSMLVTRDISNSRRNVHKICLHKSYEINKKKGSKSNMVGGADNMGLIEMNGRDGGLNYLPIKGTTSDS